MEKQNTAQPQTKPLVEKNKNKNTFLIIFLIILFFIASGTAGYALYQTTQLRKQINQLKTEDDQAGSRLPTNSELTPSPNPTENWETFTNQNLKLSFKYPHNFFFKESPSKKTIFLDTQNFEVPESFGGPLTPMQIGEMISTKTKQETITEHQNMFVNPKVEKLTVDDLAAIEISGIVKQKDRYAHLGGSDYTTVLIPIDDSHYINVNLYEFNQKPRFSKKIFDQIISTFKFLD